MGGWRKMQREIVVNSVDSVNVELKIPGDKSVSHRSVIFASLAKGITKITNFLSSEDCIHTMHCFKQMGVSIKYDATKNYLEVVGLGLKGLVKPSSTLEVGNSGTAIRLLLGLLSAQKFDSKINGDESIQKRPMDRVAIPLTQMGAELSSDNKNPKLLAPINILGNKQLKGIKYTMPVSSAQVKSCIMLAGLYASEPSVIVDPGISRDHTERMLKYFGGKVDVDGNTVTVYPADELYAKDVSVPSDISSASFFIVAGLILKNSVITLPGIGLNPTRTGIIDVLKEMGGDIRVTNLRNHDYEPVGDIEVRSSVLKGISISGEIIPRIIDEIPVICVAASQAQGQTIISDAQELKVKESDRIATTCSELSKFGVGITSKDDGMIVDGSTSVVNSAECNSYGDHRIAMSCAVLGLLADGQTKIKNVNCISTSFPEFFELFSKLMEK